MTIAPPMDHAAGAIERSERIAELEGLRAVLAWTVVGAHICICSGFFGPVIGGAPVLGQIADAAVDLFLLLSGFAITRLLLVEHEPPGVYALRRACRIVPAYWVALTAAILLNSVLADNLRRLPPSADAQGLVMICELGRARLWIDAPLHYAFLHGLVPAPVLPWASLTLLGVAWSLSLEAQFYAIAPAALRFAQRRPYGLAVLVLIAASGLVFANYWMNWFTAAFIGIKGGLILAGALTFTLSRRAARGGEFGLHLLPVNVAALLWWYGSGRSIEAALAWLGWTAVMIATFSNRFSLVSAFLNSSALQHLGRVSYSTYLFHVPVITVVQAAVWRWINPGHELQLLLWTIAGTTVGTLVVAEVSWRVIERPFQRVGRRRGTVLTARATPGPACE
jgi:peptidoglycan/LPS O-acetylase OafA/YrhL